MIRPAVAIPSPPSAPPDCLIRECAIWPQITAGIPVRGPRHRAMPQMPRIMLARARPDCCAREAAEPSGGGFICNRVRVRWLRNTREHVPTAIPFHRFGLNLSFWIPRRALQNRDKLICGKSLNVPGNEHTYMDDARRNYVARKIDCFVG